MGLQAEVEAEGEGRGEEEGEKRKKMENRPKKPIVSRRSNRLNAKVLGSSSPSDLNAFVKLYILITDH